MTPPLPPRIAEHLLRALVPEGIVGESIVGDAREEFQEHLVRAGPARARARYCMQVLRLGLRYGGRRPRGAPPAPPRSQRAANLARQTLRDTHHALRTFTRTPGFVTIAVLTLALGIGADAAVFSVVNGVLLKPLPYPEPGNLAALRMTDDERGDRQIPWSVPNLRDVERETTTFESITGYQRESLTLTGVGEPTLVNAVGVTGGLLETLGVRPLLGRDIRKEETVDGGPAVALLSHAFWQEHLGGDAGVLGRTIRLSEVPFEVVGVAPPDFEFPPRAQVWVPGRWDPDAYGRDRYFLNAVGRLAPDLTLDMAQVELSNIAASLAEQYPASNGSRGVAVYSLTEYTVGDVRLGLLVMFGAVSLVLLTACANVANLLLVRGSTRVGEMAVRATLGAGRGAIVRQLLIESFVLSGVATVIGVVLAFWGVEGLRALSPGNVPRLDHVTVDGTVLGFAAGLAVVVTVAFGLAPAYRLGNISIAGVVRDGRDAEMGLGRKPVLRSSLLALEMAISLVLLVGAGLLLRSFAQIRAVDLGFDPTNVQQFTLSVPTARYDDEQTVGFFRSLEERLAALPGVEAVGMNSASPLGRSHTSIGFDIVGRPSYPPEDTPFLLVRRITPGYLASMRIPLLAGRRFDAGDRADAPRVVIISHATAQQFFPGEDPVGQQITFDGGQSAWSIVGIAGDVRSLEVTTATEPEAYFPHAQWTVPAMTVTVRTAGGRTGLVPLLKREVAALDPMLALYWVESLDEVVARSTGEQRVYLFLLGLSAGLAVVLAAVGLYSVVAYVVSRRTREIGIRIALGARWKDVARLVVWQGMLPTAAGAALGLIAALAGTRILSSLLYQVEPGDPLTFVLGTGVLFVIALCASVLPARAAARVSPTEAIRGE